MSFVFFSSLGIFSLQNQANGPNAICTPPNNKAQQQEQIIPAKYRHCYGLPFFKSALNVCSLLWQNVYVVIIYDGEIPSKLG